MGETAEERARRLRQIGGGEYIWRTSQGVIRWSEDELCYYEQMIDEVCREMIMEVREEPDVSLVKKYNKGSFKF